MNPLSNPNSSVRFLDARDCRDRPKPKNHVEFKGDFLWLNPDAPVPQRQLNMKTVEAHMKLAEADQVPALFNLPERGWGKTQAEFLEILAWWQQTLAQIKAVNPSQAIGVYAEVPVFDYWLEVTRYVAEKNPQSIDSQNQWNACKQRHGELVKLNRDLQIAADAVSIICPTIYLHYQTEPDDHWAAYARFNIDQARQYGKPLYPVVWPRYHPEPNKAVELNRWLQYVQTIVDYKPDGIIVWDYSGCGPWEEVQKHFEVCQS